MLLHDRHALTFVDIAKCYFHTSAQVEQLYSKQKNRQIRLYFSNPVYVPGYRKAREFYHQVNECCQNKACISAYFEVRYAAILQEHRAGEPGAPLSFLMSLPPFRPKPNEDEILKIAEMRENKLMSFAEIGIRMYITRAKAVHTYHSYYHEKVIMLFRELQNKTASEKEKRKLRASYILRSIFEKKLCKLILEQEFPDRL